MQPSKYQQGILDWITQGEGNATCNAVAGSGKTTTLKLAAKQLQSEGYSPAEIKVIVFGKQNSLDLIEKFGQEWKQSIQTLHSVGFRILQLEIGRFRRDERIVNNKYRRIAEEKKLIPRKTKKRKYKGSLTESQAISRVDHFLKLIDLARLKLSDLSTESIREITYHHNLEGIHNFQRVSKAIA
ncbi:MAG: UvrD-helicase domain-containing protein, partial [Crocosphaera sp.]